MPSEVQPERLLKELRNLWVDLGKDEPSAVLRACAMTLIVVVEEERDPQALGETLASLMHEHPSRAIVLRVRSGAGASLSARVFAQCWMPFGRNQQICCEQVEIVSSLAEFADTTAILRSLIAPDLPVVLYCPTAALWPKPEFTSLLPLASKLIIDSQGMENSPAALGYLQGLPKWIAKADLVWSRITPWRESIAQIFEDSARRRSVYELEEIQVLYHSPFGEPSSVYYLAGWFMSVLGAGVKIRIAPGVGPDYAGIAHILLSGPQFKAEIDLAEAPGTVEVSIDAGLQQVTVFPPMSEGEALRRELAIVARDVRFQDALGLGHLMHQPAAGNQQ